MFIDESVNVNRNVNRNVNINVTIFPLWGKINMDQRSISNNKCKYIYLNKINLLMSIIYLSIYLSIFPKGGKLIWTFGSYLKRYNNYQMGRRLTHREVDWEWGKGKPEVIGIWEMEKEKQ